MNLLDDELKRVGSHWSIIYENVGIFVKINICGWIYIILLVVSFISHLMCLANRQPNGFFFFIFLVAFAFFTNNFMIFFFTKPYFVCVCWKWLKKKSQTILYTWVSRKIHKLLFIIIRIIPHACNSLTWTIHK